MSTIEPKKTLFVEYPVPASRHVFIRVAAEKAVDLYAMDQDALDAFLSSEKKDSPIGAIAASRVGTTHELPVTLPVLDKWFLVVHNPWEMPIDVQYTVSVMSEARGSLGLGSMSVTASVLGGPTRR